MWHRLRNRSHSDQIWIFCDGSSGSNGRAEEETAAGLLLLSTTPAAAAVARRPDGRITDWAWKPLPEMTSNEAEYAGLLLGLELAQRLRARETNFVLDSEVVVGQIQGRFAVNSATLRPWHQQACAALRTLPSVHFYAVPRTWNRLADGLAGQAAIPWRQLLRAIQQHHKTL